MANVNAGQVFNGTFAHIWIDDEKIGEATGISAKVELETEDVKFCGTLASDRKVVGYKCSGSLKLHKISSKFQKSMGEALRTGKEQRFTIIVKLDDPGANGEERVVLKDVAFDDLTILEVEVGALMKVERPFSFRDWEFLDSVD